MIVPATASAEGLFGGHVVGVKGAEGAVLFYDWDSGEFIQKIEAVAKDVALGYLSPDKATELYGSGWTELAQ